MSKRSSRQAGKREKVLLHIFCHAYGTKVVLLLNGYDKAADASDRRQQREITLARRPLVEFKGRQARERKSQRRGGGRDLRLVERPQPSSRRRAAG